MIKKFDFLGDDLTFYYKDSKKIKTSFGGLISIVLLFFLVLLLAGFGRDFFLKIKP